MLYDGKMEECGYEHLHLHTDFSLLDGLGQVEEYAEKTAKINQKFLCVSDHGMMGVIPRQVKACEKAGISPIFACELYVNNDHVHRDLVKDLSPIEKEKIKPSYHLLAIAQNNVGYKNLVQLTSWAWINGFYRKPRVTYKELMQYKEGIIFTSCCYNSEIGRAFDRGGKELADRMIERYMKMFPGQFYLEIMLLDFKKQHPYNAYIIDASQRYGLPLIVTNDVHYCNPEDSKQQQYMLMIRGNTTIAEINRRIEEAKELNDGESEDIFELQDTNLSMKSEQEIDIKWKEKYRDVVPYELYCQAKANTVKVAELCKGVQLDRSVKLPQMPDADEDFREKLLRGFKWRGLHNRPNAVVYKKRLIEEYELICRKGFSSYFLILKLILDEARRKSKEIMGFDAADEAVGPGRGSCGGSLACFCLGITDVDPIHHDLLFSRFLNESRGGRRLKTRFTGLPVALP